MPYSYADAPHSKFEVAVVGSINIDIGIDVARRPLGGETLGGSEMRFAAGGKGANQAAAAARADARTCLIGCLGDDQHAALIRGELSRAGVDISCVCSFEGATGSAFVMLTPDGENSIVVSPGANGRLDIEAVRKSSSLWSFASVVLLSFEIPAETVEFVAVQAAERGSRVVVNAAPARPLLSELMALCDPLIVNEHEARIVLGGIAGTDFPVLARRLINAGVRSCVITLGAAGCLVADRAGQMKIIPAHRVSVVDTTGAGDAFAGAIASELARGADLWTAAEFATAMASLAVQSRGAMTSYPSRANVNGLLLQRSIAREDG